MFALVSQTITFAALQGKTYGNPPFTVSATASSGLPISFASLTSAVCTVGGSTVTIVAAGTCTIQASQAGNATHAAAPNVSRSFVVSKASQTITFGALAGKTYGNPPFTVSAAASSGLAVTFSSTTTPVCTVSGSTVTIVAGGTCTIKASQAGNASYLAANAVNQSFTVARASQTITFAVLANKTYGDPTFTVSATASSGLPVTFSSTTTAVCTVSGSTVTIIAGGTCTINASQAGNPNYLSATPLSRSFTVAKKNQTITFGALAARRMDQSPFTVSATASSGLTVTFTSTTASTCTLSGITVTLKGIGTCTIQASQAGNANYLAATLVSQSFAVSKGIQTITFNALSSKVVSDPPFSVTATTSSSLPVFLASLTDPVCTVSGSTVTLVAAGACTIRAYQPGNTNWNPANIIDQSFNVVGSQSIAFDPIPNQPVAGSVPLTATASSGLAVSFASMTPSTCSVTGTTANLLALGVCTIRASQAGGGYYAPAPTVDQTFNVLRAQTITFPAIGSKSLGIQPFSVSATASSGLAVTIASQTLSICSLNANTVTLVAVGVCTIRASQSGDATYGAAPDVDNTFSVTPTPSIQYFYDAAGNVIRIQRN